MEVSIQEEGILSFSLLLRAGFNTEVDTGTILSFVPRW
jgi:hypothetical protein